MGHQKSPLAPPSIDCSVLLIKTVPGLTLGDGDERNHIELIYFSPFDMCSLPLPKIMLSLGSRGARAQGANKKGQNSAVT